MIRHSGLLLLEARCAIGVGALGRMRPPPVQRVPLGFSLTALGERERADGSWEGVDLLAAQDPAVDRFQLTVRPEGDATLTIDARTDQGWQRLFPAPGQTGALRAGISYALPSPSSFYGLEGKVMLRVTLRRAGEHGAADPEPASSDWKASRILPLSDGTRFPLFEHGFDPDRAAKVELLLHGRGS